MLAYRVIGTGRNGAAQPGDAFDTLDATTLTAGCGKKSHVVVHAGQHEGAVRAANRLLRGAQAHYVLLAVGADAR